MNELSDGAICPFNTTTEGRRGSILGIPARNSSHGRDEPEASLPAFGARDGSGNAWAFA
jgi:hypothetical protein